MSRKSVSASLEAKVLGALRALVPGIQAVGLLEVADEGCPKDEGLTSVQVRVYDFEQPHEGTVAFTVAVEVRLNVEQAESASGGAFFAAHEAIALWLERTALGDGCAELETDEAFVDGFRRTGDDKGFDTAGGTWYAVWNMALSGRIKHEKTEE